MLLGYTGSFIVNIKTENVYRDNEMMLKNDLILQTSKVELKDPC